MKKLLLLFASLSFAFSAAVAQNAVRIGGSDLMEPEVREAIERQVEFLDVDVEFQLTGTYRAEERLRSGDYDLAFIAVPHGQEISEEELRFVPIAYKVVVAAVSQSNPLNQLAMSDLAAVFGEGETTSINRWGQLGLTDEWSARSIEPVALTPIRHSLTLDLFRHTALRSPRLRRGMTYVEDFDAVQRRFGQDNNAIALLPEPVGDQFDRVKVLPIVPPGGERAVMPTIESVHNGDYPLRLPIYLAFSPEKGAELREILRFLVGAETAEALQSAGLTPLPELQRQRLYFEFERL